ncbi:phosphotransferase [Longispora sp. K20-0274]|uniref:phosphotransferase n=1 Tax=Longispora sp. K20-0274 TaxID=3088255 RepID=UPI00399AD4C0
MELLASGRDADVYAIDRDRVLRRYKGNRNSAGEKTIMARLHTLGFPVPRVYSARQRDLIMERLYGPTMVEALVARDLDAARAGEMLADLHKRLHKLPPPVPNKPDHRVLHLDLHPGNVIITSKGPVVIDWRNARTGDPGLDRAVTGVILAHVAAGDSILAAPARELLAAYREALGEPLSHVREAMAFRAADVNLTEEERSELSRAEALLV